MQSRRSFLRSLLIGGVAFNILPGAGRVWKAQRASVQDLTAMLHFEVKCFRAYVPTFYDFVMSLPGPEGEELARVQRMMNESVEDLRRLGGTPLSEANVPVSRPKDLYKIFHT